MARGVATLFADFISLLDGQAQLSPAAVAALPALTTEGVGAFNDKYPQGLPKCWGGNGPDRVNGVRYSSWSGTLPETTDKAREPSQVFCRAFSEYFITEAGQNDGLVGRFSSHLGKVIRSDYPMDHLETISPGGGKACKGTDPAELYLRHAERLRKAGL